MYFCINEDFLWILRVLSQFHLYLDNEFNNVAKSEIAALPNDDV